MAVERVITMILSSIAVYIQEKTASWYEISIVPVQHLTSSKHIVHRPSKRAISYREISTHQETHATLHFKAAYKEYLRGRIIGHPSRFASTIQPHHPPARLFEDRYWTQNPQLHITYCHAGQYHAYTFTLNQPQNPTTQTTNHHVLLRQLRARMPRPM
jgi:hypothetical protein